MRQLTARLHAPLRIRLTLAFAVATTVLLGAVGAYTFVQVKDGLDGSLDASLRARAAQYSRLAARATGAPLRRAFAVEGEPAQLLDARGAVLAASPRGAGRPLISSVGLRRALAGEVSYERRERTRLLARPAPPGRVIVVSTSMVQRERALEELGSVLVIGGPLILLISCGAGYLVAAGALRPVDRMRHRAAEISAATPDARLPLPAAQDELWRLGETLNAMLGRLQAAAQHERAFLANASHELRTPLSILKAEVDLALHQGAREPELRAALESIGEEADRLVRLAEDLLVLARGQDGSLPLSPEPVQLAELADDVVNRFAVINAQMVRSDVADGHVVNADRLRLEQALSNLVENALRHGAAPVSISARRNQRQLEIHVTDAGGGFTPNQLDDAFQRMNSGEAGGFGLGLAIVANIARAHGGTVGATNADPGADVWIALPLPDATGEGSPPSA